MLAGDSNMRRTYDLLLQKLQERGATMVTAPCRVQQAGCDARWFDNDAVMRAPSGREFRVSLRFQPCPEQRLPTLDKPWAGVRQCCMRTGAFDCAAACEQHANLSEARWGRPYGLIYGHGLWGITKVAENTSCEAVNSSCGAGELPGVLGRHMRIAKRLQELEKEVPVFRWATNFPIDSHPSLKRYHIKEDFRCHGKAAAETGLPLLDIWRRVPENDVARFVERFHFHYFVAGNVIMDIFCALGCGC